MQIIKYIIDVLTHTYFCKLYLVGQLLVTLQFMGNVTSLETPHYYKVYEIDCFVCHCQIRMQICCSQAASIF